MSFYNTISYNLQAIIGKKNSLKILIIESDDWGLIRMPSKKAFNDLIRADIPVDKCSYNNFDSLESVEDIEALSDLCDTIKDKNGNPLKITANFIMANPNFEKIKADNFDKYYYNDISQTYDYYQGNIKTLAAVNEAIEKNMLVPQLHGREHLQVNHWLKALRSGDAETHKAFDAGVFGHPSAYAKKTGIHFLSAFHISTKDELAFSGRSVLEAANLFQNSFEFTSKTFIAPRYIWPDELETYFKQAGIETLQGTLVQLRPEIGKPSSKLNKSINWMGKMNISGLNYLTRNVFFEPALNPDFKWEADALKRVESAFFWGKPAIISMHRVNFMGGLSEDNRAINLKRLKSLIDALVKKWPDVIFMSSDELA